MGITDWEKYMKEHHIKLKGTDKESGVNKCRGTDPAASLQDDDGAGSGESLEG